MLSGALFLLRKKGKQGGLKNAGTRIWRPKKEYDMENIVYTNTENVTVEISWEDYFKEIEMRKQKRLKKKPTPKK